MKSKWRFLSSLFLLVTINLGAGLSLAQANVDIPELTWDRGRQQTITLGGKTEQKLWTIYLEKNGTSLKFERSSQNESGFYVYSVDIPDNFAIGKYSVIVRGPGTSDTLVAVVNISPTIFYDPLTDPEKVGFLAVAAFTLIAFFSGNRQEEERNQEEEDSSNLGSVDTNYMAVGSSHRGLGDEFGIGKSQFSKKVDFLRHSYISLLAPKSQLLTRVIADSSYLQSIIGIASLILPMAGIALGITVGIENSGAPSLIPTSIGLMIAIIVLAIYDSMAGLLASVSYFVVLLVQGRIDSASDIQAILGLSILWFTPILSAAATRPLRRAISEWSAWERATDILVSAAVTGWAVKSMALAVDGFAKEKTLISAYADQIALIAVGNIVIRYIFEEIAMRFTPARLDFLSPPKIRKQEYQAFLFSLGLKLITFLFFMFGFFGFSWQIFVASAILVIPAFLKYFDSKYPNFPLLFQLIPGGIPSIIFMSYLGLVASLYINSLPLLAEDKSKTILVLASIPSLLVSLLKLFGRSPKPGDVRWYRRNRWKIPYRLFGPVFLGISVLIMSGKLP